MLHSLRFNDFSQRIQTRIGYFYNTYIRINGAERVVGRFRAAAVEGVEQG